jgi:hypothetical protein
MRCLDKIRENALWAIANIVTTSWIYKDRVLDEYRICILIRESFTASINVQLDYLKTVVWLLQLLVANRLSKSD